jgi:hypothetical protein
MQNQREFTLKEQFEWEKLLKEEELKKLMKRRLYETFIDVIKWTLILIIAGVVFYIVVPKYYFKQLGNSQNFYKCNEITGTVTRK